MAQTPSETSPPKPARRVSSRVLHIALEAAVLAVMVGAAGSLLLYQSRKTLARDVAEDWLARRGIDADIVVDRLDSTGFSGRIRLGPASDPVLVADRVDVDYGFTPPWSGSPFAFTPRSVRLVHPRVKLAFDGKALRFGSLDPLIKELLARPKTNQPSPDIRIDNGEVRLATPYGLVQVRAEAALADGKLIRLDGRILPMSVKAGEASAQLSQGLVSARGDGQSIDGRIDLALDRGAAAGARIGATRLALDIAGLRYTLDGGRLGLTGAGRLVADSAEAEVAGAKLGRPHLDATLEAVELATGPTLSGRLSASGAMTAERAAFAGSSAQAVKAQFRLAQARWSSGARFAVASPIQASATAASGQLDAAGSKLAFSRAKASFTGRLDSAASAPLSGALAAEAAAGLPAAQARDLAAKVPVLSGEPAYAAALERAIRAFTVVAPRIEIGAQTRLAQLITLRSTSGVEARLSPALSIGPRGVSGAASLTVEGGGLPAIAASSERFSLAGGTLDAQVSLQTAIDYSFAKQAAFKAAGHAHNDRDGFTFALSGCAPVVVDHLEFGDVRIEDPRGEVCPGPTPLVAVRRAGWRIDGRLARTSLAAPFLEATLTNASGSFAVGGADGRDVGVRIEVADGLVTDTAQAQRFKPLRAKGAAGLAGDQWTGAFDMASGASPIGRVALVHDATTNFGHADIDASRLVFEPEGLQPGALTPLAEILDHASGPASFTGRLTWGGDAPVAGGGRLSTPGLDFTSPIGAVAQLRTDVTFTSLSPLTTAPDQLVTVGLVEAFAPLKDIRLVFDMAGDVLKVDAARLSAVGGRVELEPISVPLAADQTISGVIVLDGVNLGEVIALTSLADRIKADLPINGRLPFEFGPGGFKLLKGEVATTRPGRLSIGREVLSGVETGEATAVAEGGALGAAQAVAGAPEAVNAVQEFAYQAMEDLAVDEMHATLQSQPEGRLGALFSIKGRHDPEKGEEAIIDLRELASGQAFKKRIPLPKGTPIDLTLDTSLNFDEVLEGVRQSFDTYRNLRTQARSDAVQPKAP